MEYQECHIWLLTSWELKISTSTGENEEQYYFNTSLGTSEHLNNPAVTGTASNGCKGVTGAAPQTTPGTGECQRPPCWFCKIWAQPEKPFSKSSRASGWFTNLVTQSTAPVTSLNLTIHIMELQSQLLRDWKNGLSTHGWVLQQGSREDLAKNRREIPSFVLPFIPLQLLKSINTS